MATHDRGGLERWELGGVADKFVRLSQTPTVLVRPAPEASAWRTVPPLKRLLVPLDGFASDYDPSGDIRFEIDRLARRYKVSTLVILRRMHDAGGLSRERFRAAYDAEVTRLAALPTQSGGNFYLTLGARASKRFALRF